jgi:hypothetical protein
MAETEEPVVDPRTQLAEYRPLVRRHLVAMVRDPVRAEDLTRRQTHAHLPASTPCIVRTSGYAPRSRVHASSISSR